MNAGWLFTVDVGNSMVGLGRLRDDSVEVARFAEPEDAAAALLEAWHTQPQVRAVAISVSGDRWRRLLAGLGPAASRLTLLSKPPLVLGDERLATTAGADRLANAMALQPGAGLVVDAGTAVTLDVVDAEGRYLGGFIAPGPAVAAKGLASGTAQLPNLSGRPVPILPGGETHAALAAGLWGQAVGGVDRLVEAALEELAQRSPGSSARVVATGGWGAAWARDSRHSGIVCDPEFVHRGMALWAHSAEPS